MPPTQVTPASFVPGRENNTQLNWITEHLFRGLVSFDDQLNVLPDVAASVQISDDGRRYRFELRSDAVWSDGVPVTASDFVFAWTSLREEGAPSAYLLELLDRVEMIDERTLEVELAEARPYILYLFCHAALFPWPRHVAERQGLDWQLAPELVGNGPFVLAELDDEHAMLSVNPRWYGRRGNVEEAMVAFTTLHEATRRWGSGEFDLAVAADDVDETARMFSTRGMATLYIAYRVTDSPLSDVRVRRALTHALDRNALRVPDLETRADSRADSGGLIPPSLPAHSHDLALSFDPDRARGLLAEAGFPGGHGLRRLRFISHHWADMNAPEWAVEQWAKLGVSVELAILPFEEFHASIADVREGFDIWWDGWVADYPDPEAFLDTFLAATPAIHRDQTLLDLLDRARSSRSQAERWRLYRAVDERLVRELVSIVPSIVPLTHADARMVARRWVEGGTPDPIRSLPLLDRLTVRR
jgi:ABC-type oligopeptide transport system substrate-binding subunit